MAPLIMIQVSLFAFSKVHLPSFPGYFGAGAGLAVVVVGAGAGVVGGVVGAGVVVVGLTVVVSGGSCCAETPKSKTTQRKR